MSDLVRDLRPWVTKLRDDLRNRVGEVAGFRERLEKEYAHRKQQERTSTNFTAWQEEFLTQVSVAWLLACVFVRYLEDNDLIAERYLFGEDKTKQEEAAHRHREYFREHRHDSDREYIQHVFREVGKIPAAAGLFAEQYSPLWVIGPSGDACRDLLAFWSDPAQGANDRTFVRRKADTRFLGDLYQDLSDDVKKKYALLQTPEFVEEFILDQTLTPAIDAFGLETVTLIDPTCGSGHFLLGAFARLFEAWKQHSQRKGEDVALSVLAERAMNAVHGIDINPYAVAIARFRLMIAAVDASGMTRLSEAKKEWPLHVYAGDSLLYGKRWSVGTNQVNITSSFPEMREDPLGLEHVEHVTELLNRKYHVVVGNPPYITMKDAAVGQLIRKRYPTCHRQYSLGVPFTERFFDLCWAPEGGRQAGFVGMITANSFMKREFGKKLIEEFFPKIDLTHVIDTSGAYIPGHGIPTVILFGRNQPPVNKSVRAVLGIKGESIRPTIPASGKVWHSISTNFQNLGITTEYVSITNLDRKLFAKHPWSIGGGGAAELKELLEVDASTRLANIVSVIGYICMTRADDLYYVPRQALLRARLPTSNITDNIEGEKVRDWGLSSLNTTVFPYNEMLDPIEEPSFR